MAIAAWGFSPFVLVGAILGKLNHIIQRLDDLEFETFGDDDPDDGKPIPEKPLAEVISLKRAA